MQDFSNIFYHLGTFTHSLADRKKTNLQNPRIKIELKFEEELWYQFCLTSKMTIPIEVMFELLKVLYLKEGDTMLNGKIN